MHFSASPRLLHRVSPKARLSSACAVCVVRMVTALCQQIAIQLSTNTGSGRWPSLSSGADAYRQANSSPPFSSTVGDMHSLMRASITVKNAIATAQIKNHVYTGKVNQHSSKIKLSEPAYSLCKHNRLLRKVTFASSLHCLTRAVMSLSSLHSCL